jgi:hypothetical protein
VERGREGSKRIKDAFVKHGIYTENLPRPGRRWRNILAKSENWRGVLLFEKPRKRL